MDNYIVKKITRYYNASLDKCKYLPQEKINYYDLTFILDGEMTYIADGEKYIIRKKDAIFLPPGVIRERKEGTSPVKYVSFNFLAFDSSEIPIKYHLINCISKDIRHLFSMISHIHLFSPYRSEEKITTVLNYILLELIDYADKKIKNENIVKIIEYIDANITKKMSLASISNEMNLSKEYTSSLFKKEVGKTLTDYINEQKLAYAKELMYNYKMSLSEIASYLGYDNYSYFSKLFKNHYGTPAINFKNNQ